MMDADKKQSAEEYFNEQIGSERGNTVHRNTAIALIEQFAAQERAEQRETDAEIAEQWLGEANVKGLHAEYDLMRSIARNIRATAIERGE